MCVWCITRRLVLTYEEYIVRIGGIYMNKVKDFVEKTQHAERVVVKKITCQLEQK